MLVWRKLASAQWEDAWSECLTFLGPMRVAIVRLPNRKSLRIEAYGLTRAEADGLLAEFGGQVKEMADKIIPEPAARRPMAIRKALWVVDRPEAIKEAQALDPKRPVIVIPAAMAFGTGDHATTASCLRLLCDVAPQQEGKWEMLDLGTGSGILAIAAKKLGAARVEAHDYDPHSVRTAKENVAVNGVAPLPVRKTDVLQWQPPRTWDLVAANLFSQVLINAADTISSAVRPGGTLILSGILRIQEKETAAAFRKRGFALERTVRKGKWITLLARKASAVTKRRRAQKTR